MKIRNFGSREELLFLSSTNFLMNFELNINCNVPKFIDSCFQARSTIEILNCYCQRDGFYKLDKIPPVQSVKGKKLDSIIKFLLAKKYAAGDPWFELIFHEDTRSLIVVMEHSLGDIPTVLNFIKLSILHYKGNSLYYEPINKPIESLLNLPNLPKIANYGKNKGRYKSLISSKIEMDVSTKDVLQKSCLTYIKTLNIKEINLCLTLDLRKFFPNLNYSGYYCHIINFLFQKNSDVYNDLKNYIGSFSDTEMSLPFDKFYQGKTQHQLALTYIPASMTDDIDSSIISNIITYANVFYFNDENVIGFLVFVAFNKKLTFTFCYDTRNISHRMANNLVKNLKTSLEKK